MRSERAILGRVMLAFEGERLPERIKERLAVAPAAGMTVFRGPNVHRPDQLRALTAAFQRAALDRPGGEPGPGALPLLIGADQEGGQLVALGADSTALAGNMALGAVGDPDLAQRVGRVIGTEARAMGINVVYGPCLDLATNPANPALGVRSFGDDPGVVARLGAAMIRGLQSAGVAATVKHTPGKGDVAADTHHGMAAVDAPRTVLDEREFVPFRAAFAAGVHLAMSGHFGLPAVSGRADLPSTLSRAIMTDLLRGDLGFAGVTISDALDMRALAQGPAQALDVVAAVRAGVDLLLAATDPDALQRIEDALVRAVDRELFDPAELAATDRRITALRSWLAAQGPLADLAVVGAEAHRAVERELAERAVTLVADPNGLVAMQAARSASRVLAVMPRPADLTPADTSSMVEPGLAAALRAVRADTDEVVVEQRPDPTSIAAVRARAADADLVVIGTIDGHRQPEQLDLVAACAATGVPVIAVALRGPWDVAGYDSRVTSLATYSIQPASLAALAATIADGAPAPGRLPVTLPGFPVPTAK